MNVRSAALFLLWLPGASAQLSEAYVVRDTISDCLNVRNDHDVAAEVVACLPAGSAVTVVGMVPYWRQIDYGGPAPGWAAKKYLAPQTAPAPAPAGPIPPDAFLEVHFVDVGQGDAIFILTHDDGIDGNGRFEGYSIVIDGGPYYGDTTNPLRPYMEDHGHHGADVEALIVTHPHTDHFYGAENMSRHFTINHYYDPGFAIGRAHYDAFLAAMTGSGGEPPRAANVHLGFANFGTPDWGSELEVEFLYGWDSSRTGLGHGNTLENNTSIVTRIQYGDHVFLLMGDAEGKDRNDSPATAQYVEEILLSAVPSRLPATVLKVAHHGSETSSTIPFIQQVNPEIVVVQSGRKDFTGHGRFLPDATTLARYCDHNPNVRIYRTDQDDEADGLLNRAAVDEDHIVIRTNGSGTPIVEAFEGGQPIGPPTCG